MKVKELIKLLKKEDQNREVVISKDSEGNYYSPLSDWYTASYKADSTWSGEVGLEELTPELEERGYSEEDVLDGVPALVLKPVN